MLRTKAKTTTTGKRMMTMGRLVEMTAVMGRRTKMTISCRTCLLRSRQCCRLICSLCRLRLSTTTSTADMTNHMTAEAPLWETVTVSANRSAMRLENLLEISAIRTRQMLEGDVMNLLMELVATANGDFDSLQRLDRFPWCIAQLLTAIKPARLDRTAIQIHCIASRSH
uniref:Uncharacterized protein n=1 Tax=Plectus sambesii TaxID=2011161 RepID=A0A914WIK3_9BILA